MKKDEICKKCKKNNDCSLGYKKVCDYWNKEKEKESITKRQVKNENS